MKHSEIVAVFEDGTIACSCRESHAHSHVCQHGLALFVQGMVAFHPAAHVDEAYWLGEAELMLTDATAHSAFSVTVQGAAAPVLPTIRARFRGPARAWFHARTKAIAAPSIASAAGGAPPATSSSTSSAAAAAPVDAELTAKELQDLRTKRIRRIEARVKNDPAAAAAWDKVIASHEAELIRMQLTKAGLEVAVAGETVLVPGLDQTDRRRKRHKSTAKDHAR